MVAFIIHHAAQIHYNISCNSLQFRNKHAKKKQLSKFEVINSVNIKYIVVSFTSLQQKNTQTSREIQQHVMFILIGPHVRHFSDGNQTVCPTLKNKSWPPIMPKQRERYIFKI
jgi:cytochrome c oxidase assembly protein Cox11